MFTFLSHLVKQIPGWKHLNIKPESLDLRKYHFHLIFKTAMLRSID